MSSGSLHYHSFLLMQSTAYAFFSVLSQIKLNLHRYKVTVWRKKVEGASELKLEGKKLHLIVLLLQPETFSPALIGFYIKFPSIKESKRNERKPSLKRENI